MLVRGEGGSLWYGDNIFIGYNFLSCALAVVCLLIQRFLKCIKINSFMLIIIEKETYLLNSVVIIFGFAFVLKNNCCHEHITKS